MKQEGVMMYLPMLYQPLYLQVVLLQTIGFTVIVYKNYLRIILPTEIYTST